MSVAQKPWEKPATPLKRFLGAVIRLSAQTIIWWVVFLIIGFFIFIVPPENWGNNESLLILQTITQLTICTISIFFVTKIADDQNLTHLGLGWNKWALQDYLTGILITFIVLGVYFLVCLGLDLIKVTGFAWQTRTLSSMFLNILITSLIFTFVGWSEELLSRGFHLQTIEKGLNRFWGVMLSSIIFAYFHKNNPGITWTGLVFVFFAGLVFALAYLRTGQLWLSIGLHAGWDFFVVVVFFGNPIGNLRIFHIMDIATTSNASPTFFFILQILTIGACAILLHFYVKFTKNKKTAPPLPGKNIEVP